MISDLEMYAIMYTFSNFQQGKLENHKKDFPVHKNTFLAFAAVSVFDGVVNIQTSKQFYDEEKI